MAASYPSQARSSRPFVVSRYLADDGGWLAAEIPSSCPACEGRDSAICRIGLQHYRRRKTGPGHLLAVVRCRAHNCAFTLYPPGYAPYRRQPVMNIAPDGKTIYGEDGDEQAAFDGTVFHAAMDARAGRRWARDGDRSGARPDKWWATQGRHLRFAARLVGVGHGLSEAVRCSIAGVLSVPGLGLREGAGAVGYRGIGQAVWRILRQLRACARQALRLLVCGHLAGCWGEPLYWDRERDRLERSAFLQGGTQPQG